MARQADIYMAQLQEQAKMDFKNGLLKIIADSNNPRDISEALVIYITKYAKNSTELFADAISISSEDFLKLLRVAPF